MSSDSPVFLITGCSSGFGKALVIEALSRGYRVIATARKPETLADVIKLGAKGLRLDVTDPFDTLQAFAQEAFDIYGRIDYLINNAGIGIIGCLEEFSPDQVKNLFDTNFFGVYNVTNAVLPYMRKAKSGVIVNISSESGVLFEPGLGVYSATKAALDMYSHCLGHELAHLGIKVLTIQPGEYDTAIGGNITFVADSQKIADYAANPMSNEERMATKSPGLPGPAAVRMLDVMTLSGSAKGKKELPRRFALGADSVYHARKAFKDNLAELEIWADLGGGEGHAKLPTYAKE